MVLFWENRQTIASGLFNRIVLNVPIDTNSIGSLALGVFDFEENAYRVDIYNIKENTFELQDSLLTNFTDVSGGLAFQGNDLAIYDFDPNPCNPSTDRLSIYTFENGNWSTPVQIAISARGQVTAISLQDPYLLMSFRDSPCDNPDYHSAQLFQKSSNTWELEQEWLGYRRGFDGSDGLSGLFWF